MVKQVLSITCSPRYMRSYSRALACEFEQMLGEFNCNNTLIERDLVAVPPAQLSEEMIKGFFGIPSEDDARIKSSLALSDMFTDELLASDIIAIFTPMYNFTVPALLKSWIDLVVRKDKTFEKVKDGDLRGTCHNKDAIVVCTMGGNFASTNHNMIEPYLKLIAKFIGLNSISFVYLEGTSTNTFDRESSMSKAVQQIRQFCEAHLQ